MIKRSFVYFIRTVEADGPVKIGIARDPAARLKACQAYSPVPLQLIATIECEETATRKVARSVERQLHERYLRWHLHHEWFSFNALLAGDLKLIAAGAFDPLVLPPASKASWHLPTLAEAA